MSGHLLHPIYKYSVMKTYTWAHTWVNIHGPCVHIPPGQSPNSSICLIREDVLEEVDFWGMIGYPWGCTKTQWGHKAIWNPNLKWSLHLIAASGGRGSADVPPQPSFPALLCALPRPGLPPSFPSCSILQSPLPLATYYPVSDCPKGSKLLLSFFKM